MASSAQRVTTVDTEECEENKTFSMEIDPVQLDETQLITLKLESANYIQFQADTAQCDVIPLDYSVQESNRRS